MKGAAGQPINLRGWNGREWRPVKQDEITRALVSLSYLHHEVHEGDAFKADTNDTVMTTNDYIGIAFTTPAATEGLIHMFSAFASAAAAHLEIIESPGVLTGGVALTAYNRNRTSTKTSGVTGLKSYDSTVGGHVITGGTVLHDIWTFADKKQAGMGRDEEEFVLKPLTVYAFKLTADAVNGAGHLSLGWYEHGSAPA